MDRTIIAVEDYEFSLVLPPRQEVDIFFTQSAEEIDQILFDAQLVNPQAYVVGYCCTGEFESGTAGYILKKPYGDWELI